MNKTGVYRFIGEDGSLRYRKGRVYELEFVDAQEQGRLAIRRHVRLLSLLIPPIWIGAMLARRGFCPYATTQDFRDNWEVV